MSDKKITKQQRQQVKSSRKFARMTDPVMGQRITSQVTQNRGSFDYNYR